MRTAIMGAGAIGAYLGGMLAQAGHPVALIARGQHRAAPPPTPLERGR